MTLYKKSKNYILLLLIWSFFLPIRANAKGDFTTVVYLIRHAQTRTNSFEGTAKDMACAQMNHSMTHLSDRGYEQALELAEFFKDIPVNYIFTSEMFRTKETVEPIIEQKKAVGSVIKVIADSRINNINLGEYECLNGTTEPLGKDFWKRLDTEPEFKAPKGESSVDVRKRIDKFLKNIEKKSKFHDKTIIIVGHSRTIPPMLAYYFNLPQNHKKVISAKNADIFRVTIKKSKGKIDYLVEYRIKENENGKWSKVTISGS